MKNFFLAQFKFLLTLVVALSCVGGVTPAWAGTTNLKSNLRVAGNLTVTGTSTVTGATTQTGNFTVGGNLAVTGTSAHTGAATFTVPITKANINSSIVKKVLTIPIVNGTIADSGTYTVTMPVLRAGTITAIKASIGTAIVGGTSTLTISKNGSQTLLSTANIDPTTIAANTATSLTLTATGADLAFAAGDVIKIVHVAGTQGTDGVGESISVEYETTDL